MRTQALVGSGEVCRLTVYGPQSRVELAVPAHVPVADLLPTVLGHLGPELAAAGLEHGGWVLQRLGEPPLVEDLGTAALGLCDGDILYVRPRDDQLPPADFDDIADGVATGVDRRGGSWTSATTRRFALGAAAVLLGAGAVLCGTSGATVAPALAGSVTALLVLGAVLAYRVLREPAGGAVLGSGAVGWAALTGLLTAGPVSDGPLGILSAPGSAIAGISVVAVTTAVQAGLGGVRPGLTATGIAGALVSLGALLRDTAGVDTPGAAALLLPVTLLLGYQVPAVSAKLAGLRISALPVTSAEFQQDIAPVPGRQVLDRATVAAAHLAAQYAGLAVVSAGCLAVLAVTGGWAAPALAVVAAAVLLLQAREVRGVGPRLAMLGAALGGLLGLLLDRCANDPAGTGLAGVGGLVGAALLAALTVRLLPGRRLLPHWGYAGDIVHWLCAAAIVPLALQVAGTYARLRGMVG